MKLCQGDEDDEFSSDPVSTLCIPHIIKVINYYFDDR